MLSLSVVSTRRNLLAAAPAPSPTQAQAIGYKIQYLPPGVSSPPPGSTLGLDLDGDPSLTSNGSAVWYAVPSYPGYLLCQTPTAGDYSCLAADPDNTEVQFGGLPRENTVWVWPAPAAELNTTGSSIVPIGWLSSGGTPNGGTPEVYRPFLGVYQNSTIVMKNAAESAVGSYQGKWRFTRAAGQ